MSFLIKNSLTGKKESFVPLQAPFVRMYCCGPTVYDELHIGNFRGAIVYNSLRLWLEYLGFKVSYYYNITDIDDKIIQKAQTENLTVEHVSKKYTDQFFKHFKSLKLKAHDGNPRATQFIPQMIQIIDKLIQKDMAYEVNGDVFYNVRNFKSYGKLSHTKLDDLRKGTDTEVQLFKRDPLDFALWKRAQPREPSWDSPWGKGRPGWHIECTTMVHHCLGESIDIHGGGMDLLFPHHENERAQSEAVSSASFVKYWMHHNMFELKGQKISKSLGNIWKMGDFLKEYHGEIFKYLVLSSHYRSVVEVSQKTIYQSICGLYRVYQALVKALDLKQKNVTQKFGLDFLEKLRQARREVEESLNDDFNTAKALSSFFVLIRFFNDSSLKFSHKDLDLFLEFFEQYGQVFSLFQEEPRIFLNQLDEILIQKSKLKKEEVEKRVQERNLARSQKDFKKADQIRNELIQNGIELQDLKEKTKWNMNPSFFLESLD